MLKSMSIDIQKLKVQPTWMMVWRLSTAFSSTELMPGSSGELVSSSMDKLLPGSSLSSESWVGGSQDRGGEGRLANETKMKETGLLELVWVGLLSR